MRTARTPRALLTALQLPATRERDVRAVLDPEYPIVGADLHALRVDLSAARGRAAVHAIERSIRNAPFDRYELSLFTGQIGSGKTTELRWLAEQFAQEKGGQRFGALYADMRDHLAPRDVRLPEFLLAMFGALLGDPVLGAPLVNAPASEAFWAFAFARMRHLMKELSADVRYGPQSLAVSLRTEVGLQRQIGEALNADLETLLVRIAAVLREARTLGRVVDWPGGPIDEIVLLLDGLERVTPQVFHDGRTSHDVFYIDQLPELRQLPAHIVLTAPLDFLRRTTRASTVFHNAPRVLPMVPVHHIGDPRSAHQEGLACLNEVLRRRVDTRVLFADDEALEHVTRLSGGSLRQLFRIVIEAITAAEEGRRLDTVDIDRGCQPYVLEFERAIRGRPWVRALHTIHATGQFPDGFDPAEQQELLNQHVVFEYNGTLWYDVNPLVLRTGAWRDTMP